jgi:hypothetical protein
MRINGVAFSPTGHKLLNGVRATLVLSSVKRSANHKMPPRAQVLSTNARPLERGFFLTQGRKGAEAQKGRDKRMEN